MTPLEQVERWMKQGQPEAMRRWVEEVPGVREWLERAGYDVEGWLRKMKTDEEIDELVRPWAARNGYEHPTEDQMRAWRLIFRYGEKREKEEAERRERREPMTKEKILEVLEKTRDQWSVEFDRVYVRVAELEHKTREILEELKACTEWVEAELDWLHVTVEDDEEEATE